MLVAIDELCLTWQFVSSKDPGVLGLDIAEMHSITRQLMASYRCTWYRSINSNTHRAVTCCSRPLDKVADGAPWSPPGKLLEEPQERSLHAAPARPLACSQWSSRCLFPSPPTSTSQRPRCRSRQVNTSLLFRSRRPDQPGLENFLHFLQRSPTHIHHNTIHRVSRSRDYVFRSTSQW